jgi:CubicO group peptidase (beta-lactamase class C family)
MGAGRADDEGEPMADSGVAGRLRSLTGQQVPGVAIVIAGAEGLRDAAAAGYADLAAGVPASADMVCPWFSMTKIVTATVAVRLADRGLLDLDRPVMPLVPELAGNGAAGAGRTQHTASSALAQRRVRQPGPGPLDAPR